VEPQAFALEFCGHRSQSKLVAVRTRRCAGDVGGRVDGSFLGNKAQIQANISRCISPPVIGNLTGPVFRDAAGVQRDIGRVSLSCRPERSACGYPALLWWKRRESGGDVSYAEVVCCLLDLGCGGSRRARRRWSMSSMSRPPACTSPTWNRLLALLGRLVEAGKSVIIIEHHRAVMVHADWIIDLGPGAGHDGGRIMFEGTPADLVAASSILSGEHLAAYVGI
jgi:hypothetical protein